MKSVGLAMMIPGVLLFVFGLIDLIGSFVGFDLWGTMGISLPGVVWHYSAYIELLIGGVLAQQGWARMMAGDLPSSEGAV